MMKVLMEQVSSLGKIVETMANQRCHGASKRGDMNNVKFGRPDKFLGKREDFDDFAFCLGNFTAREFPAKTSPFCLLECPRHRVGMPRILLFKHFPRVGPVPPPIGTQFRRKFALQELTPGWPCPTTP